MTLDCISLMSGGPTYIFNESNHDHGISRSTGGIIFTLVKQLPDLIRMNNLGQFVKSIVSLMSSLRGH